MLILNEISRLKRYPLRCTAIWRGIYWDLRCTYLSLVVKNLENRPTFAKVIPKTRVAWFLLTVFCQHLSTFSSARSAHSILQIHVDFPLDIINAVVIVFRPSVIIGLHNQTSGSTKSTELWTELCSTSTLRRQSASVAKFAVLLRFRYRSLMKPTVLILASNCE